MSAGVVPENDPKATPLALVSAFNTSLLSEDRYTLTWTFWIGVVGPSWQVTVTGTDATTVVVEPELLRTEGWVPPPVTLIVTAPPLLL